MRRSAVGRCQLIFMAQSGSPFTVVMNSATPSGALCNGCGALYPNLVGNPSAANQSINQWFNQLAFAPPPVILSAITRETRSVDPI